MSKAAGLAAKLETVNIPQGMAIIEGTYADALHFDVIGDAMCVMHSDGSVNIIESMGKGRLTAEVI